jgi:hypothetical protein
MVGGFFFDCEDHMRSAYIVTPGLIAPDRLDLSRYAVPILAQNEFWTAMRTYAIGTVWRIRTEKSPGENFGAEDRIESAVGLIDSTTRWRASLAIIRTAISSLRSPNMNEACWGVFDMMVNRNPASITQAERTQRSNAVKAVIESITDRTAQAYHESLVGNMMARVVFAENDIELAQALPFVSAYTANVDPTNKAAMDERGMTVEAMVSAVGLCESFGRLAEKAPELLFASVPVWPKAEATRAAPASSEREDDDDED